MNYWKECIAEALEDAGIDATSDQIETITSWVQGAYDNYSTANGHDFIPNPLQKELDTTKRRLEEESRKIECEECDGSGRVVSYGPHHSSRSQCANCNGKGKYDPQYK